MRPVPVLAALVAALLVAGLVGAVVVDDEDDAGLAARDSTTTTTAPQAPGQTAHTAAPAAETELQAVVRELQGFVAQARGLPFREPVEVTLLDDEALRARLLDLSEEDREDIRNTARVLAALDLIAPGVDLEQELDELLAAAVLGFYDPETAELVVRGGAEITPLVKRTIVHELVHALQDQHFELHRPALDEADDETSVAFAGLVEGDAMRIEREYDRSLSREERREAAREEARMADEIDLDAPLVLLRLLVFPYETGPDFVDELVDAGGQPRLDAAFTAPPTTSEHLLHPGTFLASEGAAPVEPPPAGGDLIDQGVLGELGILLLLAEEFADAGRAAEGWGGDRYVAWEDEDRTCVRARFVMDTGRDGEELASALRAWAEDHPGAAVTGSGPVELTSCG